MTNSMAEVLKETKRKMSERTPENRITVNGKEYIDHLINSKKSYSEIKSFLVHALLSSEEYNHWIRYVYDRMNI